MASNSNSKNKNNSNLNNLNNLNKDNKDNYTNWLHGSLLQVLVPLQSLLRYAQVYGVTYANGEGGGSTNTGGYFSLKDLSSNFLPLLWSLFSALQVPVDTDMEMDRTGTTDKSCALKRGVGIIHRPYKCPAVAHVFLHLAQCAHALVSCVSSFGQDLSDTRRLWSLTCEWSTYPARQSMSLVHSKLLPAEPLLWLDSLSDLCLMCLTLSSQSNNTNTNNYNNTSRNSNTNSNSNSNSNSKNNVTDKVKSPLSNLLNLLNHSLPEVREGVLCGLQKGLPHLSLSLSPSLSPSLVPIKVGVAEVIGQTGETGETENASTGGGYNDDSDDSSNSSHMALLASIVTSALKCALREKEPPILLLALEVVAGGLEVLSTIQSSLRGEGEGHNLAQGGRERGGGEGKGEGEGEGKGEGEGEGEGHNLAQEGGCDWKIELLKSKNFLISTATGLTNLTNLTFQGPDQGTTETDSDAPLEKNNKIDKNNMINVNIHAKAVLCSAAYVAPAIEILGHVVRWERESTDTYTSTTGTGTNKHTGNGESVFLAEREKETIFAFVWISLLEVGAGGSMPPQVREYVNM